MSWHITSAIRLLREIYEEKRQSEHQYYRIIAFSAKALYAPLDKSEVEQASGFLMAVEHWTTFELSAFACLAGSIDLNLLRSILRDFIKTNDLIINDHSYRKRVVQAGTRVIFAFLDKKDFNSAITTLAYIKNYIRYTDNYSKIVYKFAYGAYLYAIGEDEQGNVMKDVIQVCETIENPLLKKRLSKTFQEIIEKNK